jgi:hypothetical protein
MRRQLGVILALSFLATSCYTKEEMEASRCKDKTRAFQMSRDFVKDRLRAPTTAEFPWATDDGVSVVDLGDCTFDVHAYVDAQNAFGAKIRNRYDVKLRYLGNEEWRASSVVVY